MNSLASSILFFVAVLALWNLARRLRKTKRIFVTDYTRGVRFVNGSFANVLGPGSYQPFSLKEQIAIVDLRPQPIVLEKISYRDACQNQSFLSIGAEMSVSDARLATTMLKDQINDSLPIVRETLRSVASRGIADASPEFRKNMAAEIMRAANAELGRVGMKVCDVEIIELWSRPGRETIAGVSH